jgi:hypothetical protein
MSSREHLLRLITTCRRDRTTGTRRRAELRCAAALGGSAVDRACAAAARRLGVWIGGR